APSLHPSGADLYVVDASLSAISAFAVNGGSLAELPGTPFILPVGATPLASSRSSSTPGAAAFQPPHHARYSSTDGVHLARLQGTAARHRIELAPPAWPVSRQRFPRPLRRTDATPEPRPVVVLDRRRDRRTQTLDVEGAPRPSVGHRDQGHP